MNTNTNYIDARNKLIPQAENFAYNEAGPAPSGLRGVGLDDEHGKWCQKWNRLFHQKMDELAKLHGLT